MSACSVAHAFTTFASERFLAVITAPQETPLAAAPSQSVAEEAAGMLRTRWTRDIAFPCTKFCRIWSFLPWAARPCKNDNAVLGTPRLLLCQKLVIPDNCQCAHSTQSWCASLLMGSIPCLIHCPDFPHFVHSTARMPVPFRACSKLQLAIPL